MKTLAPVVCAVLMLYASIAAAAPINVTESTDFDDTSANFLGLLDVGLNSVKGAVGPGDSIDAFRMVLPGGLVIKKGQLIVTNYVECGSPCGLNLHGRIDEPLDGLTEILSSSTISFAGVPFSQPGNMPVELVAPLGLLSDIFIPVEGSYDYDLQYTVELFDGEPGEITPEPGTLLMLAGGAVALALRRRRPRPTR